MAPPALLVAYLVYLRTALRDLRRGPLDWMLALVAGCLYFYIERGGNQYGPRFHYEAFLFMAVFVAANVFGPAHWRGRSRRDRIMFGMIAASVAMMPLASVVHGVIERRVIRERMDPYAQVAAAGFERAVVLMAGRVGTARSMAGYDLTRNGVDSDGPVVYGLHLNDASSCAAANRFPGRPAYTCRWDRAARRGELSPLDCP